MSLFMAGVLTNTFACNPEPEPQSAWKSPRLSRTRVWKNRRSDGANVQVVVQAKS